MASGDAQAVRPMSGPAGRRDREGLPGHGGAGEAPLVPEDESLLRRAAAGDLEAFERLVERKRDRVYRFARYVVGCDEDVEDVVQLAFIRVWRTLGCYCEGSKF